MKKVLLVILKVFSGLIKNTIQPDKVFKNSHNKYWFKCKCGHFFESSLNNILKGNWCPYYSNNKLCNNKDCQLCHIKSFANHYFLE